MYVGFKHLDKESSLYSVLQVIVTAEQIQLFCSGEISSQHVGLLKLLKLFPVTQDTMFTFRFDEMNANSA